MTMQNLDLRRDASGGYRVDVISGERVGRISSEWFTVRQISSISVTGGRWVEPKPIQLYYQKSNL
jgi:hypothetical protein